MVADEKEIHRILALLFQPGDTVEMRCVGGRTINGFYRNLQKLASDAYRLNVEFNPQHNVYVCLNPVLPDLFARRADGEGERLIAPGVVVYLAHKQRELQTLIQTFPEVWWAFNRPERAAALADAVAVL